MSEEALIESFCHVKSAENITKTCYVFKTMTYIQCIIYMIIPCYGFVSCLLLRYVYTTQHNRYCMGQFSRLTFHNQQNEDKLIRDESK